VEFREADLSVLRWAYKHCRELARRLPAYRGEVVSDQPIYPEGSEAATKAVDRPVPLDAPKIKYTEADDQAVDEYIKNAGNILFYNM
jgi:alcohol oxidase